MTMDSVLEWFIYGALVGSVIASQILLGVQLKRNRTQRDTIVDLRKQNRDLADRLAIYKPSPSVHGFFSGPTTTGTITPAWTRSSMTITSGDACERCGEYHTSLEDASKWHYTHAKSYQMLASEPGVSKSTHAYYQDLAEQEFEFSRLLSMGIGPKKNVATSKAGWAAKRAAVKAAVSK